MNALDVLAQRASAGEDLTDRDAALILDTRDLIGVGMAADQVRRRLHGARTSFVRVLEVSFESVPSAAPRRLAAGEIRITGSPASPDAAVAAVRAAVAIAGSTPVLGFSLADLHALSADFGAVCARLREAGLDGIAEVPVDRPGDAAAVLVARQNGLAVTRLTVHQLEPPARAGLVVRARQLQAEAGGFRVFAPLPRAMSVTAPTTGYDDVKQVALARLLVPSVESIQVDWALYGPKLAQVALIVGADDVDNVAAVEAGLLGSRRSAIEEIRTNIRAAGLEPWERDGRFEARA